MSIKHPNSGDWKGAYLKEVVAIIGGSPAIKKEQLASQIKKLAKEDARFFHAVLGGHYTWDQLSGKTPGGHAKTVMKTFNRILISVKRQHMTDSLQSRPTKARRGRHGRRP